MILKDLIDALAAEDPDLVLPLGFHEPHSYRGDYMDLAFMPAENITIGGVLAAARSALGATYQGYKGGDFTMGEHTDCWLAQYGSTGETVGPILLRALLEAGRPGGGEPGPEPAPDVPEVDALRAEVGDLRHAISRAREALGTDRPTVAIHDLAEERVREIVREEFKAVQRQTYTLRDEKR